MDYIKKQILDEYEMLKEWNKSDGKSFCSKYRKLVELAKLAASSRKHRLLTTDDLDEREMLDIFNTSLLDTPSFSDEPELPYLDWGEAHCYAIEAHYEKGYLEFELYVGCGSFVTCRYVKTTKYKVYPFSQFKEVLWGKVQCHAAHAAKIREELAKDTARMDELEKTLASVNAANALMDIFGLKMDGKSAKKVDKWNAEYHELKRKLK